MSLSSKSTATVDQFFKSFQSVQDAGFRAASAVSEKVPGVPGSLAVAATKGTDAWVRSYFRIAQQVLDAEQHTAEQLVAVYRSWVSPRPKAEQRLQAV
ncbi:MAG: hypothetical protein ACJ74E_09310 [Actinomycetes bacterium]